MVAGASMMKKAARRRRASTPTLHETLSGLPAPARDAAAHAAREGFLAGLNSVLVGGAVLAFAGAVVALVLVRESDIDHEGAAHAGDTVAAGV